jgi:hypothetical protein
MTGDVPEEVAERRYERWVMRAAESIMGLRPASLEEAEETLLLRLDEGTIGKVSPRRYFEPEEVPDNPKDYLGEDNDEDPSDATRSMVFALYEAAGGQEWGLHIEPEGERGSFVRVFGVSIDLEDEQVDISVDLRSLACENTYDLRALHERIVRELPKRELGVEEAANDALYVVEEMREMLEGVRELSDAFEVREETRDVEAALENLWMALSGIAALEEDRRLRGGDEGVSDGADDEY